MMAVDENDNVVLSMDEYQAVCQAIKVYQETVTKLEEYAKQLEKHIELLQEYNQKKAQTTNNKVVVKTRQAKPKLNTTKPVIEFLDT